MSDRPLAVGVGAGGHAGVVIEAARLVGIEFDALVDSDPALAGRELHGVPVVGDDDELMRLAERGYRNGLVLLGSVRGGPMRAALGAKLASAGIASLTIVHPAATVSPTAIVGPGAVVLAGSVVATGARVGEGAIVNHGAIVDHDCEIGAYAHVSIGAVLSGNVTVGRDSHVGAGAVCRQGVVIGDGATVGAGAVVVRDVRAGAVVVGVPAREQT